MKISFYFLLLFVVILEGPSLSAQYFYGRLVVEQNQTTGKYGVVDNLDGTIYMPYNYDSIEPWYSDTLITVVKNGAYGIFTYHGKELIPPKYDRLQDNYRNLKDFKLYAVKSGEYWSVVNHKNKLLFPFKFDFAIPLSSEIILTKLKADPLLYFYDKSGKFLFNVEGIMAEPGFDSNTIEVIKADYSRYFLDKNGKNVFPDWVKNGIWTDGKSLIISRQVNANGTLGKFSLLNWEGDTILPFFSKITPSHNGHFIVEKGNEAGLFGQSKNFLIPLQVGKLSSVHNFQNSPFSMSLPNGYHNLYDKNGQLIIENCNLSKPSVSFFSKPNEQNVSYLIVFNNENNRKGALYSLEGKQLTPFVYDNFSFSSQNHPIIAKKGKEYQLLDFQGLPLFESYFSELKFTLNPNIFIGRTDEHNHYGFVDIKKLNNTVFKYNSIERCEANYFSVKEGNKYYLHNPNGKRISDKPFDVLGLGGREEHEAFRKMYNQPLIAQGFIDDPDHSNYWIALDKKGKHYKMDRLPSEDYMIAFDEQQIILEELPVMTEAKPIIPTDDTVHEWSRNKPEFLSGGEIAMINFIAKNKRYPQNALDKGIKGTVVVTFIVEKNAELTNIKIEKSVDPDLDNEAIRLIKSMPKWRPATTNDFAPIRYLYRLPIEF